MITIGIKGPSAFSIGIKGPSHSAITAVNFLSHILNSNSIVTIINAACENVTDKIIARDYNNDSRGKSRNKICRKAHKTWR